VKRFCGHSETNKKGIGFFYGLKMDWFLYVENLFCGNLHFLLVWNVESDRILIVSQTLNQTKTK
jgi:hypothetical protein